MGLTRKADGPGRAGDASVEVLQAGEARSARIESLRALAALAVVFSHVFEAAKGASAFHGFLNRVLFGGGFAVWVFFALTGYLLYLPFARHQFAGSGKVDYRRYAVNRAVRILPLYYTVVIVCLIWIGHGGTIGEWVRFGLFGETYSYKTLGFIDGPIWSLVVEVQFYILLPFLVMAVHGLARRSIARAGMIIGALCLLTGFVRWATYLNQRVPSQMWRYTFPATCCFFFPGMLLALLKVRWDSHPPAWLRGATASSAMWVLASVPFWLLVFDRYNWDLLVGPASFLLIGACVLPLRPSAATRVLEWRPLAVLGVASYSLYLWHFPLIQKMSGHLHGKGLGVDVLVMMPVTIVVALVSYRVVEAPFLRLRRRWQGSERRPAPR